MGKWLRGVNLPPGRFQSNFTDVVKWGIIMESWIILALIVRIAVLV